MLSANWTYGWLLGPPVVCKTGRLAAVPCEKFLVPVTRSIQFVVPPTAPPSAKPGRDAEVPSTHRVAPEKSVGSGSGADEAEGLELGDALRLLDGDGLELGDELGLGLLLPLFDGELLTDELGLADGEALSLEDGDALGLALSVDEGEALSLLLGD